MSNEVPKFNLVELPYTAVTEGREQVRGALLALGLYLPTKEFVISAFAGMTKD